MLFAAIGVAGLLTYGLNNIVRGPAVTTAEISRKTIAENNLVASTRLAVAAATRSQANNGDCDGDGFVEPLPYRDAGALPKPTGGGLLPATMGGSLTDPWGNQYGYCVWDSGTASVSDNVTACGGSGAYRLEGAPREDQPILAVISAGKDGTFQTSCNAYIDTTPADGLPDTPMVSKPAGSDDVILSYTYAEANGIGSGEWKLDPLDNTTAQITKDLDIQGGGTFSGPVQLQNKGLVLPGDPGDDSVTGVCDASKDQQLRRNISTTPPTLEICDFMNGGGWTSVTGGGSVTAPVTGFDPDAHNCTTNGGGPMASITSHNPGGEAKDIWGDGTYLYLADGSAGLAGYSFNGTSFSLLSSTGSNVNSVAGDGTYIYTVDNTTLRAYTFNGTAFTSAGSTAISAAGNRVYASGGYIFVADGASGLLAFTFNGSTFTTAGSYSTTDARSVISDGNYVYVGDATNGIIALTYNGSAFTLAGSITPASQVLDVWTDNVYVYAALTTGGIGAYYFNGTSFTLVDSSYSGVSVNNIWGDGVNIFAATNNGVEVYTFSGTFSLTDSLSLAGTTWGPWGDGSYIYAAKQTGGIQALNGYACLSVTAASSGTTVVQNTITDPLDEGLVSHWKMDEGQGIIAADSVGGNDLSFHNTPTWADNGPTGSSSININGVNDDGLFVNTLFGSPPQGTIGMWVNSQALNTSGNAYFIEAGSSVSISDGAAGPGFTWYDGSTWTTITSNHEILGKGWHYITATFDDPNNIMRFYIDGVLYAESTAATTINYGAFGTITTFGYKDGDATRTMDGGLDDIRIYNRALSPAEVKQLFERSKIKSKYPAMAQYAPRTLLSEGRLAVTDGTRFAIKNDGSLWSWGDDTFLQLGNGPTLTANIFEPQRVSDLAPYEYVSTKGRLACGIRKGGNEAYCWGYNWAGQAGTGSAGANVSQPTTTISAGTGLTWSQIIAGDDHAFGIKSDGTAWAWGNDLNGILGNTATTTPLLTPDQIAGSGTWASISTDSSVACGIKTDGTAWCWGSDANGQLGNGASVTGSKSTPTQVDDPGPWVSISVSDNHACGIKADGSLWCWGNDTNGILGNGWTVTADQVSPYRVVGEGPWLKVSVSNSTSCALKADTTIWCWGLNNQGQLADGTSTTRDAPTAIKAHSGWVDLGNSIYGGCALHFDGSLWCWGRDVEGELGNGAFTTAYQDTPTRVSNWLSPWAWEWDDGGTNIMLNSAYNIALGTVKLQPSATTGSVYFGFTAAGMAQSYSASSTSHVKIETTASNASSQLSFKTNGGGGATDITANRAGYWPFDDTVGSSTVAATNGTAGTVNGSVTLTQSYGKIGGSAYFSPADPRNSTQYIRMANAAYLRPTSITISFWMKHSSKVASPGFETIFEKTYNNHGSMPFRSYSAFLLGNRLVFRTGRTAAWDDLTSSTEILNDQWYYITLVMNPSGAAPQKRIYINGALDNSQTNANAIRYDTTTAGDLFIGTCCSGANNEGFSGEIDDFRIYSIGLSNTDVLALYTYTSTLFQTPRSMGINYSTNNLSIGRNNTTVTNWMDTITPDMAIASTGNVGIGTATPQAALDVNGGIRIGEDYECTAAGQAGKIRYVAANTPPWQYCNGSAWVGFSTLSATYWKKSLAAITAGDTRSCAVGAVGSAWCWGAGGEGLGNNTTAPTSDYLTAQQVHTDSSSSGWSDWIGLSTATSHTCGIRTAGTAWCWGLAANGRLGDNDTSTNQPRPVQVHSDVSSTGWTDWIGISTGTSHTCGVRANGTAWCWGAPTNGRLGNFDSSTTQPRPVQVHSDVSSTGWTDWISISAGDAHTCGVRTNGTAWCWGQGTNGKLGYNSTTAAARPVQVHSDVSSTGWTDWIGISTGTSHTCGVRANGTAWCWGAPTNGRLGNFDSSTTQPRPVQVHSDVSSTGWTDWISISAGDAHTCGVRTNGTAWCWGQGTNGKLGYNSTTSAARPVQVKTDAGATGWTDWVFVETGISHSCGVRANGTAWCWGSATNGRLANGRTTPDALLPESVQ